MDLEIVVQKAAEKADALSEVQFVEISGTLLGIASLLNQPSSLIEEIPPLIYFSKTPARPRAICFRLKLSLARSKL